MDHVRDLIGQWFAGVDEELAVGGARVSELAERYGTPFFVYDRATVEKKWQLLRSALPDEFSICYSVKANPNTTILQCLLEKGCGLEIASGGEFLHAVAAGCPPEKI